MTRTVRMFGTQKRVQSVGAVHWFKPAMAKEIGLVDELVATVEELAPRRQCLDVEESTPTVLRSRQEGLQMPAASSPVWYGDFAVVPVEPAQAGACWVPRRGHPGRRGRGVIGRFRHRQPHREPLLRVVGHRQAAKNMMQAFFDLQAIASPAGSKASALNPDWQDRCAAGRAPASPTSLPRPAMRWY